MNKPVLLPLFGFCAVAASPAIAQSVTNEASAPDTPPALVVNSSATLTSGCRFRGMSHADKAMAIQGGLTIAGSPAAAF